MTKKEERKLRNEQWKENCREYNHERFQEHIWEAIKFVLHCIFGGIW